jgi:hypothetical protein
MKAGLSLLEVLVSLVIASLTIAAIAHSSWAILMGRRQSDLQQAASLIAGEGLEQTIARGATGLGVEDGVARVADPLGDFERRTIVERGPSEALWHIVVMVTPPRGAAPVRFHTLVYRSWSGV